MKNILLLGFMITVIFTASPFALAKKHKESPICSYGKTEYINSRKVFFYKSNKACTLKNGAKWYCRKEQTKNRKQIRKYKKKIFKTIYDNKYTKMNMFITPFSFKGKNTKKGSKCKLVLRQLTCKFKSCTFN